MTPQEFGRKIAAELRANPDHWTQNATSRDIHGVGYDTFVHPNAVCWCLEGFIHRDIQSCVQRADVYISIENILQFKEKIYEYNDHPDRTVGDIITFMDKLAKN